MPSNKLSWRERQIASNNSLQLAAANNGTSALVIRKKEEPKRPFSTPDQMVTFEVGTGSEKETFLIHKEVACHGSPVFDKAFNGDFEEGRTQTYKLDDVTSEAFRFFSEWLYSQRLTLLDHDEQMNEDRAFDEQMDHYRQCGAQDIRLVELWILADRFMIPGLQNAVMTNPWRVSEVCSTISTSAFPMIYANTSSGSPLRSFVVDQVAWKSPTSIAEREEKFPRQMLVDIASLYQEAAPQSVKNRKLRETFVENYFVADTEES